jgi:hypothetical protein
MAKITYYDFSTLTYVSIFAIGFIENADEYGYEFVVSHEYPQELADVELGANWDTNPRITKSIFRYEDDKDSFLFCIDAGDPNWEPPVIFDPIPFLERCRYYFKVNYNEDEMAKTPEIEIYREKIWPLSHVFPLLPRHWWRFLPKLTPIGGRPWPFAKIKQRMKNLRDMIRIDELRALRDVEKDIDLFFVSRYRQSDVNEEQNDLRLTIINEMSKNQDLNLLIGFVAVKDDAPQEYLKYKLPWFSYSQYLNLLARSRVAIHLHGSLGSLSFRFGEEMSIGKPLVGVTLLNNKENLYEFDRFDEQFAYDDPYDMVERINYLLEHPDKREELRKANIETFERHLVPKSVAVEILTVIQNGW